MNKEMDVAIDVANAAIYRTICRYEVFVSASMPWYHRKVRVSINLAGSGFLFNLSKQLKRQGVRAHKRAEVASFYGDMKSKILAEPQFGWWFTGVDVIQTHSMETPYLQNVYRYLSQKDIRARKIIFTYTAWKKTNGFYSMYGSNHAGPTNLQQNLTMQEMSGTYSEAQYYFSSFGPLGLALESVRSVPVLKEIIAMELVKREEEIPEENLEKNLIKYFNKVDKDPWSSRRLRHDADSPLVKNAFRCIDQLPPFSILKGLHDITDVVWYNDREALSDYVVPDELMELNFEDWRKIL